MVEDEAAGLGGGAEDVVSGASVNVSQELAVDLGVKVVGGVGDVDVEVEGLAGGLVGGYLAAEAERGGEQGEAAAAPMRERVATVVKCIL